MQGSKQSEGSVLMNNPSYQIPTSFEYFIRRRSIMIKVAKFVGLLSLQERLALGVPYIRLKQYRLALSKSGVVATSSHVLCFLPYLLTSRFKHGSKNCSCSSLVCTVENCAAKPDEEEEQYREIGQE